MLQWVLHAIVGPAALAAALEARPQSQYSSQPLLPAVYHQLSVAFDQAQRGELEPASHVQAGMLPGDQEPHAASRAQADIPATADVKQDKYASASIQTSGSPGAHAQAAAGAEADAEAGSQAGPGAEAGADAEAGAGPATHAPAVREVPELVASAVDPSTLQEAHGDQQNKLSCNGALPGDQHDILQGLAAQSGRLTVQQLNDRVIADSHKSFKGGAAGLSPPYSAAYARHFIGRISTFFQDQMRSTDIVQDSFRIIQSGVSHLWACLVGMHAVQAHCTWVRQGAD